MTRFMLLLIYIRNFGFGLAVSLTRTPSRRISIESPGSAATHFIARRRLLTVLSVSTLFGIYYSIHFLLWRCRIVLSTIAAPLNSSSRLFSENNFVEVVSLRVRTFRDGNVYFSRCRTLYRFSLSNGSGFASPQDLKEGAQIVSLQPALLSCHNSRLRKTGLAERNLLLL